MQGRSSHRPVAGALQEWTDSTARVMLCVQFFQSLTCYMSIYLCGGQVTMAEQHLYHSQICTMVEQMGGKGVPQRMWR